MLSRDTCLRLVFPRVLLALSVIAVVLAFTDSASKAGYHVTQLKASGDGSSQLDNAKLEQVMLDQSDPNGPSLVALADDENKIVRIPLYGKDAGKRIVIAGNGIPCQKNHKCGDGGKATEARIGWFANLAVSPSGDIGFIDHSANRLRVIDKQGMIRSIARIGARIPGHLPATVFNPLLALRGDDSGFWLIDTAVEGANGNAQMSARLWRVGSINSEQPTFELVIGSGGQLLGDEPLNVAQAEFNSTGFIPGGSSSEPLIFAGEVGKIYRVCQDGIVRPQKHYATKKLYELAGEYVSIDKSTFTKNGLAVVNSSGDLIRFEHDQA